MLQDVKSNLLSERRKDFSWWMMAQSRQTKRMPNYSKKKSLRKMLRRQMIQKRNNRYWSQRELNLRIAASQLNSWGTTKTILKQKNKDSWHTPLHSGPWLLKRTRWNMKNFTKQMWLVLRNKRKSLSKKATLNWKMVLNQLTSRTFPNQKKFENLKLKWKNQNSRKSLRRKKLSTKNDFRNFFWINHN